MISTFQDSQISPPEGALLTDLLLQQIWRKIMFPRRVQKMTKQHLTQRCHARILKRAATSQQILNYWQKFYCSQDQQTMPFSHTDQGKTQKVEKVSEPPQEPGPSHVPMFKAIIDNTRGFGNKPTIRRIKILIACHNLDFLDILEPMSNIIPHEIWCSELYQ